MPRSQPRRTTSKSGGSASSKKAATSRQAKNSSATAPASFEQVFGKEHPNAQEITRLKGLIQASLTRLDGLQAATLPSMALYRTRHLQRLAREKKHLQDLNEALESLTKQ